MIKNIMAIHERLYGFVSMILIVLLCNGYVGVEAQPASGNWNAPTDFGQFGFTVNEDGSLITQFVFDVTDWSCANVSGSWNTTITWTLPNTGCPIADNTFSYQSSSAQETWDVTGTFNQTGDQASGTWSYAVSGGSCSGIWGPVVLYNPTVIPPGDVSGTWTLASSPYLIDGDIHIPNDSTLTIEPGVLVEFQGHYKLNVQGRLLAEGTETDTIVFTINDTTGFSNPDIPDGGWSGIRFQVTPYTNDSSKIDYCKLQYGKAIGNHPEDLGGAVWVSYFNKLLVSNCLITNNYAVGGGGIALTNCSPKITGTTISYNSAGDGGGIDCGDESSPIFENNLIVNNSAKTGGGILVGFDCNPILRNTIIENNNATDWGGGIWSLVNTRLTLENVTLKGNTASEGGGINSYRSDLIVDRSSFINNSGCDIRFGCGDDVTNTYQLNVTNSIFTNYTDTTTSQVGIKVQQGDAASANVIVDKCAFTNNLAKTYVGLRCEGDDLNFTLTNSIFSGNEAINMAAGAMFLDGCSGTVTNCLFASNNVIGADSNYPGSVFVWFGANVDFMNCTFADNTAFRGGGLSIGAGGISTTTNCIFWGNSVEQISIDTSAGHGGTLTVNYCDIQGGAESVNITDTLSSLIWGDNNMDADPLFVDPAGGDFHIQEDSPCNGAGIETIEIEGKWLTAAESDIEGNPCPNPAGTMPDIGAYEAPFDPVGIDEKYISLPGKYSLSQNYPNPFSAGGGSAYGGNPGTTIEYKIPAFQKSSGINQIASSTGNQVLVTLKVYDILGKEVALLVKTTQRPGQYEVNFDASNLTSGLYFYKLSAGNFFETKKMLLIK